MRSTFALQPDSCRIGRLPAVVVLALALLMPVCAPVLGIAAATRGAQNDVHVVSGTLPEKPARELTALYPTVREELERQLGWSIRKSPTVRLLADRQPMIQLGAHPLTVALAVPEQTLVLIDYPRAVARPFQLRAILKHELCHLLLHQNIPRSILPRWLDEGICQWVSDGMTEVLAQPGRSRLVGRRAATVSLRTLERAFPEDDPSFLLAYEISRSFVSYLLGRFGREGVLALLAALSRGQSPEEAFDLVFSRSLAHLEGEWRESLSRKSVTFSYLSYHIYELLFACGAMLLLLAFIRVVHKRRKELRNAFETERPDP